MASLALELTDKYSLGKFPYKKGDGVNITGKMGFKTSSKSGIPLENDVLWKLELSPLRYAYLSRFGAKLQFHIREFSLITPKSEIICVKAKDRKGQKKGKDADNEEECEAPAPVLRPTTRGVTLDQQQTRDLMEVIWPVISTVERRSKLEVSNVLFLFYVLF